MNCNHVQIGLGNEEGRVDQEINETAIGMTIFGKVVDSVRCTAIENVGIKLTDTEYNPLFHTSTNFNGEFIFANLPIQYYILLSSHLDYFTSKSILINPCSEYKIKKILLNPLPKSKKNIISGKITDIKNKPLSNCIVKLFSKKDTCVLYDTTTDGNGDYVISFNKKCNMCYYLLIDHCMYRSKVIDIPIEYNKIYNINVHLSIDEYCGGTISGIITDVTGNPVSHGIVILFDACKNKPISFTYTNDTGCYLFYNLKIGDYYIKSNKLYEENYIKFEEPQLDTFSIYY
jgi:hypothetical protein